jgi:hypothetical protein
LPKRAIYEIRARIKMKALNCFTIRGDHAETGIFISNAQGFTGFPTLRDFVRRDEVATPIGRSIEGNKLMYLAGGEYIYLFIDGLESLQFGDKPFCKGLNIWAGGELEEGNAILWKSGETRGHPKRRELWRIRNKYRLILVDLHGGISIVQNHEGTLELRVPSFDEVAAFFRQYLKAVDLSPRDANWDRRYKWGTNNLSHLLRESSRV